MFGDDLTGEQAYMLYLNDGAYGNFSNIIFDHQHPTAQVLHSAAGIQRSTIYSIWGPNLALNFERRSPF